MGYLIFLITVVFIWSAFFVNIPQETLSSTFATYVSFQKQFIFQNSILFTFGIIILTYLFYRFNFDKQYSQKKIFFYSSLQTVTVGAIGFFLSYALLLVIAWTQLTIVSLLLNANPKTLGITTNTNEIIHSLKGSNRPPHIIATDKEENKVIVSVVRATSGVSNFYGRIMLSSVPEYLVVPLRSVPSGMLFIDHTLIVTEIREQDIQAVSPYIGYTLVKAYFPYRKITSYPKITFMNKKEYRTFRNEDAKKKIVTIDLELKKVDEYISSYSAALKRETNKKNITSIEKQITKYQSYQSFFNDQKERLQNSSEYLPNELGVFKDPNVIRMVYDTDNPHAIADYFVTLTHEYLHYASFVSKDDQFTSSFFEEGLTEYFARGAIKNSLATTTNLGYPVQVKIITTMTNMLTESELAEIYFHKDEDALERALDRVYGDGFYQDNEMIFETMQYAASKKDLLLLANLIMEQIDGEAVTEKDLTSSYSNL